MIPRFASGARAGVVLVLMAAARGAASEEAIVEFFRSSFLPETASVELGGLVSWRWVAGEHQLASGRPDGAPGTPDEPGALFDVRVDREHPSFEFRFDQFREGGYFFFDRLNPGQVGAVSVHRGEISLRVGVVDNIFLPEIATIFEGDSVRWEHEPMEDFHTVTSGRSSRPVDNPGALFDAESSDAKPVFVYRFDLSGDYPYFCRPHEFMDMKGVVIVQRNFLRGDTSGDGKVDISDPIATLGVLFLGGDAPGCLDALDGNDDGSVDIADPTYVLNFLFLGGAELPPPHPFPGADRTEDAMLCRA
jgi:plastocyanin